jgi:hypothetical protein
LTVRFSAHRLRASASIASAPRFVTIGRNVLLWEQDGDIKARFLVSVNKNFCNSGSMAATGLKTLPKFGFWRRRSATICAAKIGRFGEIAQILRLGCTPLSLGRVKFRFRPATIRHVRALVRRQM